METIVSIAKALSEEKRLRILMALRNRELCSCQISEILALTDSTVSTHMGILKRAGLVESRKEGRWVYYRLPHQASPEAAMALNWVHTSLINSTMVKKDEKKLNGASVCQRN